MQIFFSNDVPADVQENITAAFQEVLAVSGVRTGNLNDAISWALTPQGREYWSHLHNKYKNKIFVSKVLPLGSVPDHATFVLNPESLTSAGQTYYKYNINDRYSLIVSNDYNDPHTGQISRNEVEVYLC